MNNPIGVVRFLQDEDPTFVHVRGTVMVLNERGLLTRAMSFETPLADLEISCQMDTSFGYPYAFEVGFRPTWIVDLPAAIRFSKQLHKIGVGLVKRTNKYGGCNHSFGEYLKRVYQVIGIKNVWLAVPAVGVSATSWAATTFAKYDDLDLMVPSVDSIIAEKITHWNTPWRVDR